MTNRDCTASTADLKNTSYLYPVISSSKVLNVAEDDDDYKVKPLKKDKAQSMQIDCKALQRHIQQRMEPHKHILPARLHETLDELNLFLEKRQTIELFDLLIEFNIRNDVQPARDMIALMAVLDADALNNLEEYDIINAASFIRDTMEYQFVRWHLEDVKKREQPKKKRKE